MIEMYFDSVLYNNSITKTGELKSLFPYLEVKKCKSQVEPLDLSFPKQNRGLTYSLCLGVHPLCHVKYGSSFILSSL